MSNGTLVHTDKVSSLAIVQDTMESLKAIRTYVQNEFTRDLDYGVIPGTGTKPTLLLPGAQKAFMYFHVFPSRTIERTELGGGHLEVLVTTHLKSQGSGQVVGEGSGSCSSMEGKYRFRNANRKCPACGKEAIFKSKRPGEGYYCWAKKDGCGAQFREGAPEIENQAAGKVDNDNIHDVRNTILKMGIKRADVSAAMSLACLSELFTQDLEDTYDLAARPAPEPTPPPAPAPAPPPPPAPATKPTPPPPKPEPPRRQSPVAGPTERSDRIPASGGSLWRWATEVEKLSGSGLIGHMLDRARGLGWPGQMKSWTAQQVQEAFDDAQSCLEIIYGGDDVESTDGGDDGRYDERNYN